MKSLLFQIGAGLVLVLCGVWVGMQIGVKKVVVVRAPDPGAEIVRSHRTAHDLARRQPPKRGREDRPRIAPGDRELSVPEVRLKATKLAKRWIEDITQEKDRFRRQAALDAIRDALAKGSEVEVLAALQAFLASAKVDFDKASFREVVERHLASPDGWTRRNAWYALFNTERREGDLELVRKLADDPSKEVRQSASHLIMMFGEGDLTGDSGEVVQRMLDDEDRAMRREVLRGMWGATLSPDLEARVIDLSRSDDREQLHDAVYFALSTQANKSVDSVWRLIEVMRDPDWKNSGRAAWGLRQGVPPEAEPMIAEAALQMMQEDAQGRSWKYGLELLKRYAGPAHLEAIEALAGRKGLPQPVVDQLAEAELQAARGQ